tara:strand:- start:1147 stop:1431 length:285 start_codon:yes stop_codon:yes gene_type:complete
MAHFTEAQAQSSKLESCKKEFTDGNFAYWVLRVSGSDGQYHQFVDHSLAADASISDIKAKLVGHLTGSEFYVAPTPPVISGSIEFSSNVGDSLG